jgi:hypothetical protein
LIVKDGRGGQIRTGDPLLPKQMRYQTALRPDALLPAAVSILTRILFAQPHFAPRGPGATRNATIGRVHGGYSSAAERLTVAQDVVGSIPTSRPN